MICLLLTESNTNYGTFQYIENSEKVKGAIQAITGSLGDKVIKATLISGSYVKDFYFDMQKENNAISFSKEIILEENQEFMEALSKNA